MSIQGVGDFDPTLFEIRHIAGGERGTTGVGDIIDVFACKIAAKAVAMWLLPVPGPPISTTLSAPSMKSPRCSCRIRASFTSLEHFPIKLLDILPLQSSLHIRLGQIFRLPLLLRSIGRRAFFLLRHGSVL